MRKLLFTSGLEPGFLTIRRTKCLNMQPSALSGQNFSLVWTLFHVQVNCYASFRIYNADENFFSYNIIERILIGTDINYIPVVRVHYKIIVSIMQI